MLDAARVRRGHAARSGHRPRARYRVQRARARSLSHRARNPRAAVHIPSRIPSARTRSNRRAACAMRATPRFIAIATAQEADARGQSVSRGVFPDLAPTLCQRSLNSGFYRGGAEDAEGSSRESTPTRQLLFAAARTATILRTASRLFFGVTIAVESNRNAGAKNPPRPPRLRGNPLRVSLRRDRRGCCGRDSGSPRATVRGAARSRSGVPRETPSCPRDAPRPPNQYGDG